MKLQKDIRKKGLAILLLTFSIFMYSCEKEKGDAVIIREGAATVIVKLLGVESNTESLALGSGVKSAKYASMSASADKSTSQVIYSEVQTQIIPFSDDISIVATLTPADIPVKSEAVGSRNLTASAESKGKAGQIVAATSSHSKPLDPGVKYVVVVYKSDGSFKASKEYSYGNESAMGGFALDGGEEYTFVAYSINSDKDVPTVTGSTLSTASVSTPTVVNGSRSGDLMYFKKTLKVTKGDNYLDVILKHQFSQITTTIGLSSLTEGNITSINSTMINRTHRSATIKLSDGVLGYSTDTVTTGAPVIFPTIASGGTRSISSNSTSIISPATTTGKFNIGSITVFVRKIEIQGYPIVISHTKGVEVKNLRITPGRKYNLNLEFVIPCTKVVDFTQDNIFNWKFGENINVTPRPIEAKGADFGFVFNLDSLDNSFNMTINGKNLITHPTHASREIQFQTNAVNQTTYPQNVQFADGAVWEFPHDANGNPAPNAIPAIWQLKGTPGKPVFRLVINPEGKVSMYGSKKSGGDLYPLVLNKGFKFNDIIWNKTHQGINKIVVSQVATGPSHMYGSGVGQQILTACP